jgi:tRNA (cytidine/uridine-2'-O-)-methyltransferase
MFRIVLFEPEIPPNTGNVIRLCANTGAELHLVRPLGFDLDRRSLRRAGLDYRWMARVHLHDDFASCRAALADGAPSSGERGPGAGLPRWFAIETGGAQRYDQVAYRPGDVLLFGQERRGLPEPVIEALREAHGPGALASLPMLEGNRSLNLSNAVAIVVYEAWRQNGFRAAGPAATARATGAHAP